jgi:hypothetical protein
LTVNVEDMLSDDNSDSGSDDGDSGDDADADFINDNDDDSTELGQQIQLRQGMLRSSTHKGDANKEELQSTYILFARAEADPDARPNTKRR